MAMLHVNAHGIRPASQFLPLLKFIQKIPCSKIHLPSGLQIFRYCEFFSAMKGSEVCKDRKSALFPTAKYSFPAALNYEYRKVTLAS